MKRYGAAFPLHLCCLSSNMLSMKLRHFKNHGEEGQLVFITTTCLDFVPLFASESRKLMMARSLVDDLSFYGSRLHAFVIMPEHLHWICTVPARRDVSWLVNRVKSNSGKVLGSDLTHHEQVALQCQTGLNRRSVWQRSFRSYPLESEATIQQKLGYIHANPVRRGLSKCPFSYYATSARFHEFGAWTDGLALPRDPAAILECRWPWLEDQP